MKYITVKEAAEQWGITERRVQSLCREGAIHGAKRWGKSWALPADAQRPIDGRKKEHKEAGIPIRRPPFITMTVAYHKPGGYQELYNSYSGRPVTQKLIECQLAYFRGDIRRAEALAREVLKLDNGFEGQAGGGLMLSLCGIYKGDLGIYREGKSHLVAAPCRSEADHYDLELWTAALECEILDTDSFPRWIKLGHFKKLPLDSHPPARFYYLKYMYVNCHERAIMDADRRLVAQIMRIVPAIGEPLTIQTEIEGAVISEIYLRLICAIAYHNAGQDELAIEHIDKAIDLCLPDGLYMPFVELRKYFDYLLDKRLNERAPEFLKHIKALYKSFSAGWTSLHNLLLSRKVSNDLTIREREVSRLAVYGLSNKEIADWLHISLNSVKQALRLAMDKTGAKKRADLSEYI